VTLLRHAVPVLATMLASTAQAEVKQASASSLVVEHRYQIAATPGEAWQVLVHPERYWPKNHTWSGEASNLSLAPEVGGCFCERWGASGAEHGRVVMVIPDQLLRIRGSLGPFLEMAVVGVLSIRLAPKDGGTEAVVSYRISGDESHRLDQMAAVVDPVIGEQLGGFAALANKSTPRP